MFQSSLGQKAGCNGQVLERRGVGPRVSILTRPEGRMQSVPHTRGCKTIRYSFNPHPARRPDAIMVTRDAHSVAIQFQSSPGQKAGCNPPARAVGCPSQGFNPHPTRRPDAISISGGFSLINRVFQSSPGQKAGCNAPRLVSSNTRSRGFNPHPARRPDAISPPWGRPCRAACFNPHPARRPDAIAERCL